MDEIRNYCPVCKKSLEISDIVTRKNVPICAIHNVELLYKKTDLFTEKSVEKPAPQRQRYYIGFWVNYFENNKWKSKSFVRCLLKNVEGKENQIIAMVNDLVEKIKFLNTENKSGGK